jgi:excisionase family DNA binding protein
MSSLLTLPSLLTAEDMAALLRVSRKAIYTMVDRGELPGVTRIGRRLRFDEHEIKIWLDESRASSLKG